MREWPAHRGSPPTVTKCRITIRLRWDRERRCCLFASHTLLRAAGRTGSIHNSADGRSWRSLDLVSPFIGGKRRLSQRLVLRFFGGNFNLGRRFGGRVFRADAASILNDSARQWPPHLQPPIPSGELAKSATLLQVISRPLLRVPSLVTPMPQCRGNRHSAPGDRTPALVRVQA